ncbi:hypothetical protein OsJ_01000 [Oryza sativa Japonica Group]|uniref:Uncharacterized protein n=1 Tax=Oryza sativa subsp. japonica TaxID=39947 RepID=B9EUI8_ORYSJ|nr:hypothetical protein OsJ_01000 [Oryza sativa Japonica Group]
MYYEIKKREKDINFSAVRQSRLIHPLIHHFCCITGASYRRSSCCTRALLHLLGEELGRVGALHVELHQELLEQRLEVVVERGASTDGIHLVRPRLQSGGGGAGAGAAGGCSRVAVLRLLLFGDHRSDLVAFHVVPACCQDGVPALPEVAGNKVCEVLRGGKERSVKAAWKLDFCSTL